MEPAPQHFDTLSQAINALRAQGYTQDLDLEPEHVICKKLNLEMVANDFEVDSIYRFEGDSNPDDMSILYAISSEKHDLKGLLVDAFGPYGSAIKAELIEKLRYRPNPKQ